MKNKVYTFTILMFVTFLAHSASFDCDKAKTIVEKNICSSKAISKLDDQLNILFNIALMADSDEKTIRSQQREWLSKKRNSCNDDQQLYSCLINAYRNRIHELNEYNDKIASSTEYDVTNKNPESCSPNGKQKANAYINPAETSDQFGSPDGVGTAWSFSVQANVIIGDKKYKLGKIISPRGGRIDGYHYIDPVAWDCVRYKSD